MAVKGRVVSGEIFRGAVVLLVLLVLAAALVTQREMDLARSIQDVTEEVMLRLSRTLHRETGAENLCLAGGVALNCVGNVFRGEGPRLWALAVAVVLVVPAIVLPRSLIRVHRVWMAVGETLGWINTSILLSVVFYGIVTPMGIIMRCLGRDPMHRRFDPGAATYRVLKPVRPGAHMTRQF